jgi:hypothetical protein
MNGINRIKAQLNHPVHPVNPVGFGLLIVVLSVSGMASTSSVGSVSFLCG